MSLDGRQEIEVRRVRALPEGFDVLLKESRAEGQRFLVKMRDAWRDGSNRFAKEGEALFAAQRGGVLVGVCGLNADPYLQDASVGRLRHLYVLRGHRRAGVGRRLVQAALAHATPRFQCVRLRTHDAEASAFYEALGFLRTRGEAHATHAWPFAEPFPGPRRYVG